MIPESAVLFVDREVVDEGLASRDAALRDACPLLAHHFTDVRGMGFLLTMHAVVPARPVLQDAVPVHGSRIRPEPIGHIDDQPVAPVQLDDGARKLSVDEEHVTDDTCKAVSACDPTLSENRPITHRPASRHPP